MRTDWFEPNGPEDESRQPSLRDKWLWFFGIAAISGAVVIVTAYALRATLLL